METIKIYADGGSRGNGSPEAISGYGIVILYGEHIKEYYEGFKQKTNNQMEIMGAIKSLELLRRYDIPVELHSDSAYLINCMNNRWYVGWKKNGWRNSKKKPVENRELWEELLDQVAKFRKVDFIKVKGHSDNEWNNRADELANMAMDEVEV